MIGAAGTQLHAMVLLGINCGYGNTDCATLPMQALDLRKGWVDFPRPKTGVPRRCPLWPETVAALQEAIKDRPEPSAEFANRVFVTRRKAGWEAQSRLSKKGTTVVDDPISKETAKLLKRLGFHRSGLGFYALRHTFQTVGGLDKDAIGYIMGHVAGANDMGAVYNEEAPEDGRLLAVVNHIHSWLFPAAQ